MNNIDIITIIDRNATAVSVQACVNDREYKVTGSSKREKGDVSNPDIGLSLATARAFRELADELEADGQAMVRAGEQAKLAAVRRRAERAERRARAQLRARLSVDEIEAKFGPGAANLAARRRLGAALSSARGE